MMFRTAVGRGSRTVLLAGAIAGARVGAALAQTPPAATQPAATQPAGAAVDESVRQRLHDAFTRLDLSPQQQEQLGDIFRAARAQAEQLRQQYAGDTPVQQAMRRRHFLEQLRSETDAVLTPAQRQSVAPAWASLTGRTAPATQRASIASTRTPATQPVAAAAAARPPRPTTAPARALAQATPEARPPEPRPLQRLQAALAGLNLSSQQRQQIAALVQETRQQFMADSAQAGDRAQRVRELARTVRLKLRDILSTDQLAQLRDAMQAGAQAVPPMPRNPAPAIADETGAGSAPPSDNTITQSVEPKLIAPGATAPPFLLRNLNGDRVSLAQFHGRVLVLVFGSYTSPVFRDRAAGLEHLWLANDSADTAAVVVVYTREAHPTNGWQVERNKTDHVLLAQPDTIEARREVAAQCRQALHLTIPMLVDSMDDATSSAYGTFPDGAVVIGRDGKVVAAEHWAEPSALQRAIDIAVKTPTTRP